MISSPSMRWLAGSLGTAVLLVASAAAAASLWALPRLRFDHAPRSLLRADAEADRLEEELARAFGSDDILLLAWEVPTLLDPEVFAHVERVTAALTGIEGLEEIYSVASDAVRLPLGTFPRRLRAEDLETGSGRAHAREALRRAPVYAGTLYNDGLDVVAVATTVGRAGREERDRTIDAVRALARRLSPPDRPIRVSGVSAFAREAAHYAVRDLLRIGAVALAASLLALVWMAGSARLALLALASTGLPPLLALGAAALAGVPVTAMGAALFPVLGVIGITNSLHLLNLYGEALGRGAGVEEAAAEATRRVALPVLLGLGTTAAAFFSLSATGVPAFHAGGTLVALGTLAAMPVVLLALPAGLIRMRSPPPGRLARRLDRPLVRLASSSIRHAGPLLALALLLTLGGIGLLARARVGVDILASFKAHTEIAQTYRFLDERLTATVPVDAILTARAGATSAEILRDLEAFSTEVERIPGVASAQSLATLVLYGRSINPVPIGDEGALAVLRAGFKEITARFEHLPSHRYRIKMRVREGSPPEVLDRIEASLPLLKSGTAHLTGLYVRAVGTTRSLLASLLRGTVLMAGVVLLVVGLAFRSLRLVLAAVLPNVAPPAFVFGGAVLAGISIDITAVAVGAVAVGLAIDGTLHLLFRLVAERRKRGAPGAALLRTQRSIGRALVISTLVLVSGLCCLALSAFLPTARFGIYTAAICLVALLGDLVALPAGVTMSGWSAPRSRAS